MIFYQLVLSTTCKGLLILGQHLGKIPSPCGDRYIRVIFHYMLNKPFHSIFFNYYTYIIDLQTQRFNISLLLFHPCILYMYIWTCVKDTDLGFSEQRREWSWLYLHWCSNPYLDKYFRFGRIAKVKKNVRLEFGVLDWEIPIYNYLQISLSVSIYKKMNESEVS